MLDNIIVGNYFPVQSNIHNMHPVAKIICTILFLLMAIFNFSIEVSGILILLIMILIMNTSIPLSVYYYIIKKLRYIILIFFLLSSLISFSLLNGLIIAINIILIILMISILTLTTPPMEIVYGLEKILYPLQRFKIKTNDLALNMSMALRFIPILIDESDKILKSEASYGIDYRLSLKIKIKAIQKMIKPAIKKTLNKQKNIRQNMKIRLFSLGNKRTNFRINKWSFFDTYLIIIHITILIIIIMRGVII